VGVELEALEAIVQELLSLQADVADREPTVREQTATAAFLAQFYTGVENILKRISAYHNVPVPTGETGMWTSFGVFVHRHILACRCCSMRLWK
jgi:hypothetical protein